MRRDRYGLDHCGCARVPADPGHGPRPFRLPGDPEHFGRARPFELHHLRLTVRLDVARQRIAGHAEIDVTPRDLDARTLVLDAVAFDLEAVERTDGGGARPLAHRYDGERLHVELGALAPGERATVSVRYAAAPRRGLYFLAPDAVVTDRPRQVWSQCQDEDARHWIPCHDFPNVRLSTEMIVYAPAGWTVISNGKLVAHAAEKDAERWHWRQDASHAMYLVTLVAGTFAELDASSADVPRTLPGALPGTLPVKYFVDPGREADGLRAFGRTPAMLRHFGEVTGVAYPWDKYYQVAVHDFIFGGMENTSATTMTDRILLDERAALDATSDDIVAHELAHQWFGDLVTCRDWSHAWLNEGFATFFEHVDWELKAGRDAYLYNLKEHGEAYFAEDDGRYRRPVVCNTYAYPIDLFDRHLYEKGAWVLHMLRAELGDRLFWAGVKTYLDRHRGGVVETRDLLRALEDASGRALEAFFDQWVYKAGYPDVEVEVRHEADQGLVAVTVRQTQKADAVTPMYRFRMGVAVVQDDGTEVAHTLDVREDAQTFALRCPRAPRRVVFDPAGAILMKLSQKVPRDLLLDTLAHDPRAIARWRAAQALGRRDDRRAVDALARAVREDAFWGVGVEAARALGDIRSREAGEALAACADVAHARVRRAVVRALGEFRTEAAARLLTDLLTRGDPSVLVEAEAARAAGRTRQGLVYEPLVAAIDRPAWRDVVRAGVIDGLAALRDDRAMALVDRYAAYGYPSSTRRAAVAALAELGEGKRAVRERLEALLDDADPYFAPEVLRALGRLRDPHAAAAVRRCQDRSLDGRIKRAARETLRELQTQEHGDEFRRVRDEMDHIREEARGLRDEVARLRVVVEPAPGTAPGTMPGTEPTRRKASPARKKSKAGAPRRPRRT